MTDDIVTRLHDLLDGPVPMTVTRENVRDALAEIERLTEERDDWQTAYHQAFNELGRAADELDQLRRLGDTLAYHVRAEEAKEMYSAVKAWEEARRG